MTEIKFPQTQTVVGPPEIKKSGILSPHGGEASVFVWKGKLMMLENRWDGYGDCKDPCAIILDYFTGEVVSTPVASDRAKFYSCYCEDDRLYVFATRHNKIHCYITQDLLHWEDTIPVRFPVNFQLYNTAVCKGDGCYMLAVEAAAGTDENDNTLPNPYIGTPFTEFFARSEDLVHWELLPFENGYTRERYNACPAMKYCDGYYYMICLEALPCYRFAPYIYRTSDFETWEIGFYNPLFIASREDLIPKPGVTIPPEALEQTHRYHNTNNSDLDLCEFEGKTYIVYCNGNQGVTWGGHTCEAIYDGPLDEFLKANFR